MSPASPTPVNDLYLYQIGSESTWGTEVAQTAKLGLMEELEFDPEIEALIMKDKRASLAPGYESALLKSTGSAKAKGIATYQDLPYWLDSLFGQASPSGANPYVRDYIGALGTIPTRRVFTLAKGMSTPYSHCYSLLGALVSEMSIKIEASQPWRYEMTLPGKSYTTDTINSLSDRTQTPIMAQETSLYIDAVGGTIGSTQISTTFFGIEINIKSNAQQYFGIGAVTPAAFREAAWEATMKLHMEVASGPKGYLDSIIGTSLLRHQIRVKATTGASAIQQFDFAGTHTKAPKITSDKDGIATFEFEMMAQYNSTLGNFIKASNTNAVATLA